MDIKKIKAIVDMIKESGIAELEITEGEEKLRVSCVSSISQPVQYYAPGNHVPTQHIAVSAPQAVPQSTDPLIVEAAPAPAAPITGSTINSPMVGTFYRSSSPTSGVFVEIGQEVKVGQVLCIIEAMKLMNQIESEKAGIIKDILVKDGSPVEYGQPLFIIA